MLSQFGHGLQTKISEQKNYYIINLHTQDIKKLIIIGNFLFF